MGRKPKTDIEPILYDRFTTMPFFLGEYLGSLEAQGRTELLETLCLMLLHNKFFSGMAFLVLVNAGSPTMEDGQPVYKIKSCNEYEDAIDIVCKSKYFAENFTEEEIARRRFIAKRAALQIGIETVAWGLQRIHKPISGVGISYEKSKFSVFEHKKIDDSKTQITFNNNVTLDEMVAYLKNIIGLKNPTRKPKANIGRDLTILQLEQKTKKDFQEAKKSGKVYKETVIIKNLAERFKNMNTETASKVLTRMKEVRRDINTPFGDK